MAPCELRLLWCGTRGEGRRLRGCKLRGVRCLRECESWKLGVCGLGRWLVLGRGWVWRSRWWLGGVRMRLVVRLAGSGGVGEETLGSGCGWCG